MTLGKKFLKKIKGDASFRSFYRKKNKKKTSIIVSAQKEKEKNLLNINWYLKSQKSEIKK